jgi:hypothetical protein
MFKAAFVFVVATVVTLTPAHTYRRSVVVIEILEDVVAEKVYLVRVVVRAVDPVAVQKSVPVALFKRNFARGNITPELEVLFIQTVNVTLDPAGITPDALGTPLCVSKALTKYSPTA